MIAPNRLFLDYSSFREEWKVLDTTEKCYGIGTCPEEAIASARVVTNRPIYANSISKGIVDGEPVIREITSDEITEETILYGREEIIEAMAELSGFKVRKVVEDGFFIGYTMELVE